MCKCSNKGGFPPDDEYSIQQGDLSGSCACLDIFYPHQYIQNEENANTKSGIFCKHILEHIPVLAKTVIGTIYYDKVPLCTFHDNDDGSFLFSWLRAKESYPEKKFPELVSAKLNYATGEVTVTWGEKIEAGMSVIVVCYEYNLECQQQPLKKVSCPNCKHEFYDVSDDAISLQKLANGDGFLDLY